MCNGQSDGDASSPGCGTELPRKWFYHRFQETESAVDRETDSFDFVSAPADEPHRIRDGEVDDLPVEWAEVYIEVGVLSPGRRQVSRSRKAHQQHGRAEGDKRLAIAWRRVVLLVLFELSCQHAMRHRT